MSEEPAVPGEALDLAAAEFRVDRGDVHALVEALAARLEGALPGVAQVQRRRTGGLRSRRSEVARIEVTLGEERYVLSREAHGFACTRHRVVRGITLKRETISTDEYVRAVVAGALQVAQVAERDRLALQGLLG